MLERIRRADSDRYTSFVDIWEGCGCVLVFTSTQASELRRYEDAERREGRYQVLADLAPIRTDLPLPEGISPGPRTFLEREIIRALAKRGLLRARDAADDPIPRWTEILPGYLNSTQAAVLQGLLENEIYSDLLNHEYAAATFEAEAEKHHGPPEGKGRVRDISNVPVPPESVLAACTAMEKQFSIQQERFRREELPPIREYAKDFSQAVARGFFRRAAEIGPRATLLELLPISGLTKEEQLKLTTHEHAWHHVFEVYVRKVARELFNADESDEEFLGRSLKPSDCPGTWLQRRLELCIRRACPDPEPNDHFDAERLAYLPYVDLMLTDKKMAEFVRKIRNDESTPARVLAARPAVAIPDTIDSLEEVIRRA